MNQLRVFFGSSYGQPDADDRLASRIRIGRGVLTDKRLTIKYLYAETTYPMGRKQPGVKDLWFKTPTGMD